MSVLDVLKNTVSYELIIQAVGIIAMAFVIMSFQFKKVGACFAVQLIGTLLFAMHFAMIGAWGGCLMNVLGAIQLVIMLLGDITKKRSVLVGLISVYICATALVILAKWDSLLALLSGAASIAGVLGMWTRDDVKLRIVRLSVTSPGWLIYNGVTGSLGGVICELFCIGSIIVYFIRQKLKKQKGIPRVEN